MLCIYAMRLFNDFYFAVAPPPKAPRRTNFNVSVNNNNNNENMPKTTSQDLFGSTPFNSLSPVMNTGPNR